VERNGKREIRYIEKELRERGFTERQIEAGIKYYLNFCSKFDINPAKSVRMIIRMIENMRNSIQKT